MIMTKMLKRIDISFENLLPRRDTNQFVCDSTVNSQPDIAHLDPDISNSDQFIFIFHLSSH